MDGVVQKKPSFKSKQNAEVVLSLPKAQNTELAPAPEIGLDIIYQDSYLAVINKPPGITVHPGIGTTSNTLVHALLAHFPELPDDAGSDRPGIVHRLDRDTRGLLLIAKTSESHRRLAALFQNRKIRKIYHALVWGNPGPARRLAGYIRRHPKERRLMQFSPVATENSRQASLFMKPLKTKEPVTLIEIELETGRTHQIRATFAALGCPVTGDTLYGDMDKLCRRFKIGKARRAALEVQGLCLQASQLEFDHPFTGDNMKFTLPIPESWYPEKIFL